MNEFIEKLIGRLEEEIKKINDEPWLDCEERIKKQCIYCNTIKIVNELAEEYKNSISTADYDSIIAFIESEIERTPSYAEHYTQISIMNYVQQLKDKNNNGWIPCSERLPEDGIQVIATYIYKNEVCSDWIVYRRDGDWYWGEDEMSFPCEVIAWQPLPAPYTEGE